jgi:hypothetical protein
MSSFLLWRAGLKIEANCDLKSYVPQKISCGVLMVV